MMRRILLGKYFPVIPNHNNLEGQKNFEELYDEKTEKVIENINETTATTKLIKKKSTSVIIKKLLRINSKNKVIKNIEKEISSFSRKKKFKVLSQII